MKWPFSRQSSSRLGFLSQALKQKTISRPERRLNQGENMSKEIVQGQIGDFGVGYEVKIEDGQLKVAATADFSALISKLEKALPDGSLKPIEMMVLEMLKSAAKAV
jgi:hypothetical protein